MNSIYDWEFRLRKSPPILATTRYMRSNTAPCSMYNFLNIRPTCEMVLWVELKEEEQSKGGEGWEKEIESIKPSPKPLVIYHHFDVYTVYHLTFDICYCARRNVGILINAGAKKAFEHFNVILINLCLYLYLGKRSFFQTQYLGKVLNNDRCVNAFSITSTDNSIKQKYFFTPPIWILRQNSSLENS